MKVVNTIHVDSLKRKNIELEIASSFLMVFRCY